MIHKYLHNATVRNFVNVDMTYKFGMHFAKQNKSAILHKTIPSPLLPEKYKFFGDKNEGWGKLRLTWTTQ